LLEEVQDPADRVVWQLSGPFDSQLQNGGVELHGLIGHLGLGDNALSATDYIQLPDESQIDAELTTSELVALVLVSMLNLQDSYKKGFCPGIANAAKPGLQ
jgi:hypothetical protein